MVRAIDPSQTYPYVLERELHADSPTTFHLRALTLKEREFLFRQQARVEAGDKYYTNDCLMRDVLVVGLDSWSGLQDQDGNGEVPFVGGPNSDVAKVSHRPQYITTGCLERLPFELWGELTQAILSQAHINADDRKN